MRQRLDNALPFEEPLQNAKQHYGMNTNLLRTIVNHWKNEYDWRKQEKFLNKFSQFKVRIQGLEIHFLHVKPKDTDGLKVYPLLLIHGWPGSVREFYELIPLLTRKQHSRSFVFEVVAPSLPGEFIFYFNQYSYCNFYFRHFDYLHLVKIQYPSVSTEG